MGKADSFRPISFWICIKKILYEKNNISVVVVGRI